MTNSGQAALAYGEPRKAAATLARMLLDEIPIPPTPRPRTLARHCVWVEARTQAGRPGHGGKAILRIRRSQAQPNPVGLTQREVAALLNLSERGVREIERRAFKKLRTHPALRELWRQFLAGELEESALQLTRQEIAALFRLARNSAERQVLRKVFRWVQR